MKVLITGATGLVGKELVAQLLEKGHTIHYLTTSRDKIVSKSNFIGFYWNPNQGFMDENAIYEVDAIIHLAGATVSKRWTPDYKQEIIESRVISSNLLFKALKHHPNQVKQIISASAIGIYPNSLTAIYKEDSTEVDDGFLGRVVVKWEESVDAFTSLSLKVCKLRTGLVLSNKGGALAEMVKPIQYGVGAAFGSGKQIQAWIHNYDMAALYVFALENQWSGIFNAVAPNPVSNEELTKVIAKTLKKPLFMPNIPRFVMKFALGEMHELLFNSQNVSAQKVLQNNFKFAFETVEEAIQDLLK